VSNGEWRRPGPGAPPLAASRAVGRRAALGAARLPDEEAARDGDVIGRDLVEGAERRRLRGRADLRDDGRWMPLAAARIAAPFDRKAARDRRSLVGRRLDRHQAAAGQLTQIKKHSTRSSKDKVVRRQDACLTLYLIAARVRRRLSSAVA